MRIKDLRLEKGLKQIEIATELGISRQVFANYENEVNSPDPKMLIKIANFFDVSVDYLIGRSDEMGIFEQKTLSISLLENELLTKFRRLDINDRNKVIGYASALLDKKYILNS